MPLIDMMHHIERELTAERGNATTVQSPKQMEQLFHERGWRYVQINKGRFMMKGERWLLFFRDNMVQWSMVHTYPWSTNRWGDVNRIVELEQ